MLRITKVYRPDNIDEALNIFDDNPGIRPIAGGTDLMIQLSDSLESAMLLDVSRIEKLKKINITGGKLFIGAAATHSSIAKSRKVIESAPLIAESSGIMGGPAIRNRATIGGNVANASPVAESLPTLIAHAAEIVLVSANGLRKMPVEDFHLAPGKTALQSGELILGFEIPVVSEDFFGFYNRLGSRAAVTITKVGVALASIKSGDRLGNVRIALSAVAPRVIRAPETEKIMSGANLDDGLIEQAAKMLVSECTPITDFRSTSEYRSDMVGQLFRMGFGRETPQN